MICSAKKPKKKEKTVATVLDTNKVDPAPQPEQDTVLDTNKVDPAPQPEQDTVLDTNKVDPAPQP